MHTRYEEVTWPADFPEGLMSFDCRPSPSAHSQGIIAMRIDYKH